mmetsp:Transcript_44918/g.127067  ORF Transcript_44918/g.127067 Transcript_44918/m.127067 type:complete len:225 (-) Transcript_44918:35-709(-)
MSHRYWFSLSAMAPARCTRSASVPMRVFDDSSLHLKEEASLLFAVRALRTWSRTVWAAAAAASHFAMVSFVCAGERTSMPFKNGPSASSALAIASSAFLSFPRPSRTKIRHMAGSRQARVATTTPSSIVWSFSLSFSSRPITSFSPWWGLASRATAAARQAASACLACCTDKDFVSSSLSDRPSSPEGRVRSSTCEMVLPRASSSAFCAFTSFWFFSVSVAQAL